LNAPSGVAVDAVGKLIVANAGSNSITVYPDAAGNNGDFPADVEIIGASTTLSLPAQIAVNRSNTLVELFVANSNGGNVPIFSDLGARTGNIAPSRNINGASTTLTVAGAVTGIALDSTR
jgi:DNA-binding beta-propeller fold protein YncE